MSSLLGSLGLGETEANSNHIPDGKHPGVVDKSEYQVATKGKNKGKVQHMISYRVDLKGASYHGRNQAEWFTFGDPVTNEAGQMVGITNPVMSEQAKAFYKGRLLALGAPQQQVDDGTFDITKLTGTPVDFIIVHRNGYQNINGVTRRNTAAPGLSLETPVGVQAVADDSSPTGMDDSGSVDEVFVDPLGSSNEEPPF
jgi:hypothetical protein